MIGVADEEVDQAIAVIRRSVTKPPDPGAKRATIFVVKVADYTQV
jgi:hypothetical protein